MIKDELITFSDFLDKNREELLKSEYGEPIETICDQLTSIIDDQEELLEQDIDPNQAVDWGFSSEYFDEDDI
jgi:hypothetical protein